MKKKKLTPKSCGHKTVPLNHFQSYRIILESVDTLVYPHTNLYPTLSIFEETDDATEISRQNLWCHATPQLEVESSHVGHVRLGYTSPFQDREKLLDWLNPFF